ncbi:MAG: A1 family peptidase [Deltaproteobacteria bacterium]|nr:A1 family peptidase [Deltaproteobacteria bacterium]
MKTWILLSSLFLINCGGSSTPVTSTKLIKLSHDRVAEQASLLQGLGEMLEYYITLKIDGQNFDLVADTGSSNLIVAGLSASEASKEPIDPFLLSYGGGTSINVQNHLLSVSLENNDEKSTYRVGVPQCVKQCSDTFPRILGLAYRGVEQPADDRQPTFFTQMLSVEKPALSNEFSMLLCGFKDDGSHNGKTNILFGGIEPGVTLTDSDYTPITENSWYVVNATEIKIEGKSMGKFNSPAPTAENPCATLNKRTGSNNCTIVDSGTTINQVPKTMHEAIRDHLAPKVNLQTNNPFWDPTVLVEVDGKMVIPTLPCDTIRKAGLPTVDVHIGELIVKIPSKSYFKSKGGGGCMFGFGPTNVDSPNFKILGQVAMENQYVHFDRKFNNKKGRIGFKQSLGLCGN